MRSLAPFRHRGYRRVWLGAFASNIGTWMETVGVGVFVEQVTGQAAWVGLVAAAGFAPNALLGPVGGALADRLPRKTLLITTNSIAALLAALLTFTVATDQATPAIVTIIVFVAGCVNSIAFPAYMAILPELVPRDQLAGALALSSAQWNLGRIIGPALAGIAIGVGGFEWAFGINTASFIAPVIALAPLTIPSPQGVTHPPMFQAIAVGIRFVRNDPGIRSTVGYFALNSFLAAPFIALVPSFAALVSDNVDTGTSVLVTAQGAGAVAMALALNALVTRWGVRGTLRLVLLVVPIALMAYASSPGLVVAAITIFVVGAFYLGALSTVNTIAQLRTPTELRGRVLSVNMLVLGSLYPIGSLVQGRIADAVGLRVTTAGAAVIMFVALAVFHIFGSRFAPALREEAQPIPSGQETEEQTRGTET